MLLLFRIQKVLDSCPFPKGAALFLLYNYLLFKKNWRPISLLNTDYKLVTKCFVSRLKQVVPSIVHSDQIGYLKGENIRCLVTSLTIPMKMVSLGYYFADFEKAFDTIQQTLLIEF